jgi:hypothetical protein
LDYDFFSGDQPTNAFNITVDFGSGVICSYVNGALQTLGLNDYDPDYSVALRFENKKTKESLVISSEKMLGGDLHVYDINGAKIYEANVINEAQHRINTVNWSKGIYIIKLKAKQDSWLKKIAF